MTFRHMDYPSPHGVHVPEMYYASPPSHRNRYSRSTHQTPHFRDVTWISSPDQVTPQALLAPPSPWIPPPQMPSGPSSPVPRAPSAVPPSPAPTVGEHMNLDELAFLQDYIEPYPRPQRPGLIRSLWNGLKKLSARRPPSFPIPEASPHESPMVEMPVPGPSIPSEATQYVNPTPSETTDTETETETETGMGMGTQGQRSATPYTSPYARPSNIVATPALAPGSLRASPILVHSMGPPPITIVSPSTSPSPLPSPIRSARVTSPRPAARRSPSVVMAEPVGPTEEGSQTLHEPVPVRPHFSFPLASMPMPMPTSMPMPMPVPHTEDPKFKFPLPPGKSGMPVPAIIEHSSSKGSLTSTMARFRRFVADLDSLPWVADEQIADEYIPVMNPRSRLRARMRQGADPSWYNPRPEAVEKREHWSEWDMWAKQSAAALWEGTVGGDRRVGWAGVGAGAGAGGGLGQQGQGLGQGQWGVTYPHGYMPVQPGVMFPSGYPPPGMVNEGELPALS